MGLLGGVSLEVPLTESFAVIGKASVISPWFSNEPTQKGLIVEGGVGVGFLL